MALPYSPLSSRGPLRVMFLHTSAPIGGAETLMLNLIRRMDRTRFAPELCCLKTLGQLGEILAEEIPVFERLLSSKYDLRVLPRLTKLLHRRRVDAIITVGAGDKMFWGRLAARRAGVPVVVCSIHSTGWPDRIGRLNRRLTCWTDMFIAVAASHGRFLIDVERLPEKKICMIPNGIDTEEFTPRPPNEALRRQLGIPPGPIAGTVARLGPEKNHEMFLDVAAQTAKDMADAQFVLVGDGAMRTSLQQRAVQLGIENRVHFLGCRSDVAEILNLFDVFLLTSHIEANPVSVLESLACGVPVIATRVGSVPETVRHEQTGYLIEPGDAATMSRYLVQLFRDRSQRNHLGSTGRELVICNWSLEQMVRRYEAMIESIYRRKRNDLPPRLTVHHEQSLEGEPMTVAV